GAAAHVEHLAPETPRAFQFDDGGLRLADVPRHAPDSRSGQEIAAFVDGVEVGLREIVGRHGVQYRRRTAVGKVPPPVSEWGSSPVGQRGAKKRFGMDNPPRVVVNGCRATTTPQDHRVEEGAVAAKVWFITGTSRGFGRAW